MTAFGASDIHFNGSISSVQLNTVMGEMVPVSTSKRAGGVVLRFNSFDKLILTVGFNEGK